VFRADLGEAEAKVDVIRVRKVRQGADEAREDCSDQVIAFDAEN
jgi:hypothetical protein